MQASLRVRCRDVVNLAPGRNCIPPPPPAISAERPFPGEGGGGVYFEAPRGRNFIRPPLLYLEVWGGGGV